MGERIKEGKEKNLVEKLSTEKSQEVQKKNQKRNKMTRRFGPSGGEG